MVASEGKLVLRMQDHLFYVYLFVANAMFLVYLAREFPAYGENIALPVGHWAMTAHEPAYIWWCFELENFEMWAISINQYYVYVCLCNDWPQKNQVYNTKITNSLRLHSVFVPNSNLLESWRSEYLSFSSIFTEWWISVCLFSSAKHTAKQSGNSGFFSLWKYLSLYSQIEVNCVR